MEAFLQAFVRGISRPGRSDGREIPETKKQAASDADRDCPEETPDLSAEPNVEELWI